MRFADDDPYVDVPLFEPEELQPYELIDDDGLPDNRGICDYCGQLTNHPEATCCPGCWEIGVLPL